VLHIGVETVVKVIQSRFLVILGGRGGVSRLPGLEPCCATCPQTKLLNIRDSTVPVILIPLSVNITQVPKILTRSMQQ